MRLTDFLVASANPTHRRLADMKGGSDEILRRAHAKMGAGTCQTRKLPVRQATEWPRSHRRKSFRESETRKLISSALPQISGRQPKILELPNNAKRPAYGGGPSQLDSCRVASLPTNPGNHFQDRS